MNPHLSGVSLDPHSALVLHVRWHSQRQTEMMKGTLGEIVPRHAQTSALDILNLIRYRAAAMRSLAISLSSSLYCVMMLSGGLATVQVAVIEPFITHTWHRYRVPFRFPMLRF